MSLAHMIADVFTDTPLQRNQLTALVPRRSLLAGVA